MGGHLISVHPIGGVAKLDLRGEDKGVTMFRLKYPLAESRDPCNAGIRPHSHLTTWYAPQVLLETVKPPFPTHHIFFFFLIITHPQPLD